MWMSSWFVLLKVFGTKYVWTVEMRSNEVLAHKDMERDTVRVFGAGGNGGSITGHKSSGQLV